MESHQSERQGKHQAHKTIGLAVMTKPKKKYSSLITVLHCNIQFLHHFGNFFRVRQGLRIERRSCPHENETQNITQNANL